MEFLSNWMWFVNKLTNALKTREASLERRLLVSKQNTEEVRHLPLSDIHQLGQHIIRG
jgi:hypothetical protein